jgi:hypothetical protein
VVWRQIYCMKKQRIKWGMSGWPVQIRDGWKETASLCKYMQRMNHSYAQLSLAWRVLRNSLNNY